MSSKQSIWFRLGYALEKAKQGPPTAGKRLRTLTDRQPTRERRPAAGSPPAPLDDLLTTGMTTAVGKVLNAWKPRGKTGLARLVRGGASGAAAALVVEALRPLVLGVPSNGDAPDRAGDRILLGIGQGLVYGGVVEPRVPGPKVVKGVLYGSAEYAVDPAGGIAGLLGSHAPHKRLPMVSHLLEDLDAHDRAYVEHVIFGVALALLYGSSVSSNGIRVEPDDE